MDMSVTIEWIVLLSCPFSLHECNHRVVVVVGVVVVGQTVGSISSKTSLVSWRNKCYKWSLNRGKRYNVM